MEGVFIESCYLTVENTFSKTIKQRGRGFLTEIVDAAGRVGAQTSRVKAWRSSAKCGLVEGVFIESCYPTMRTQSAKGSNTADEDF